MQPNKKALIAVNLSGFMWFLMDDIDILRSMGYEVDVVADNRFGEFHTLKELERRGARFIEVRCDSKSPFTRENFNGYRKYRRLLKDQKYNLIICHTPIVGFLLRLASLGLRKKGCKIIYVSHGLAWTSLSDAKTRTKYRLIEDFGSRLCDAIITINKDDKAEAEKLHCPNVFQIDGVGCDIAKYRDVVVNGDKKRKEIGVPTDKILILAVGEISVRKNHRIVAEALALLENKDRYVYVICGREHGGSSISEGIMSFAKENGVNVRLLGFRKDVNELCHVADIGVIPSLREGLGMAGIQQLCAGVPVIGTAVQGIKEYVKNGETGVTVKNPYDAREFAEAILFLSDKAVRDEMKSSCLNIVNKFSLQHSIDQRKHIYDEVLSTK